MNCLIIISHPDKKSFEYKSCLQTIKMLHKKAGHDVSVLDLYADNYNPSMFVGDLSKINDNALAKSYRNYVKRSDIIYIISPTRWISLSPLLEGFIDQIFIKDFAFRDGKPLLNKKKVNIIATSTSPESLKLKTFNLLWIRLRLMVFPYIFKFSNIKMTQIWNIKNKSRAQLNKELLKFKKIIEKNIE